MSEILPFPRPQAAAAEPRAKQRRCPICGKTEEEDYRPFCSKRCKQIDLGRWLGGYYRLPGQEVPSSDSPVKPNPEDGNEGESSS